MSLLSRLGDPRATTKGGDSPGALTGRIGGKSLIPIPQSAAEDTRVTETFDEHNQETTEQIAASNKRETEDQEQFTRYLKEEVQRRQQLREAQMRNGGGERKG